MTEFRTGVRVSIPATVMEVIGSGTVVVKTAAGNNIIERLDDLELFTPYRAPTEERVEALARVMCKADTVVPDSKAAVGQPLLVSGGFVITGTTFEAWRLYAKYAQALIDKGLA